MVITRKTLARKIEPSKPLRTKSPKITAFPSSASKHNSDSQLKNSKAILPINTHNSRAKHKKQAISPHDSHSEGQRCFSSADDDIEKCRNSKMMQKNAVHIGVKHPAIGASNKHTRDNSTRDNSTTHNSTTVATHTKNIPVANTTLANVDTSNDNDNKVSAPLANVISLPDQGVLLQHENTNLPISTTVKAVIKIDGLSMTIDVPPHQHEEPLKAVEDFRKADKDGLHLKKQANKHGSRYNQNFKIYNGNDYLGFLSVEPLKKTDRFLRLDFNPSKILRSGCKIVAQAMRSIIGVNATDIINSASVTRLDIAVDLNGIDINSMLYFAARPIDSSTWGKISKHGKEVRYMLGSQYIGSSGSDHYFSVYDKRAEIIAKSGGNDDPGHEIVRVELRIKPRQIKGTSSNSKCSVQFDNLASMDNLFQKLSITEIPVPNKDDGHFALLVYAAQHVGAHTALALVKNSRKRAEYRKNLLGQAASCWKPDEYWARAITAIKKTLASIS